jgi:glycosyltransferase involved in cell wall biosynthesis
MATYAEGSQDIMKIVIGVPTYRRPKMLQQALASIAKLNIPADYLGAPVEVTVVIVDNDPERSARETVAQFSTCSSLPVLYATSAKRGLASARNVLIEQALLSSADFCAWFDDDEMVRPDWLKELLTVQQRFGADVVAGRVNSLLPSDAPLWVRPLYRSKPRTTGAALKFVATGNVLFSTRLIQDWGLRFDQAFDLTGGEDVAFFAQAAEHGARMIWAADAWVDEHVHIERMTRRSVYLRHFGKAAAHTAMLKSREGTVRAVTRILLKGIGRVLSAILISPLLLIRPERTTAKFLIHAGTGIGSLAGIFGISHKRYQSTQGH